MRQSTASDKQKVNYSWQFGNNVDHITHTHMLNDFFPGQPG